MTSPQVPTEPLTLACSDGVSLEAELRVPAAAWAAAVLLHPHPTMGGTMRVGVPSYLFDALPASGVAALRFNFRGVGASTGAHAGGVAEREDVVAALDALHPVVEGLPLALVGWSFGGDVSLSVVDSRVSLWVAVAAPLRVFPSMPSYLAGADPRPKVLAVPEHDQFCDPACVRAAVEGWESTTVTVVAGADHFLAGRLDRVASIVLDALRRVAPSHPDG